MERPGAANRFRVSRMACNKMVEICCHYTTCCVNALCLISRQSSNPDLLSTAYYRGHRPLYTVYRGIQRSMAMPGFYWILARGHHERDSWSYSRRVNAGRRDVRLVAYSRPALDGVICCWLHTDVRSANGSSGTRNHVSHNFQPPLSFLSPYHSIFSHRHCHLDKNSLCMY